MVQFDNQYRQIKIKIVYYGPALGGKTTCLQHIHSVVDPERRTKLYSLNTANDRTLFFDLLALDLGRIRGYRLTLQLYTVPGQVQYNATRRAVLAGADGVVFVADSQVSQREANTESLENLWQNLRANGLDRRTMPLVYQYNKRDLKPILSIEDLEADLNPGHLPAFPSVAITGHGVMEGFAAITEATLAAVADKLGVGSQPQAVARLQEHARSVLKPLLSGSATTPPRKEAARPDTIRPSSPAVQGTEPLAEEELVREAVRANVAMTDLHAQLDRLRKELEAKVTALEEIAAFSRLAGTFKAPEAVPEALAAAGRRALKADAASVLLADGGPLRQTYVSGAKQDPLLSGVDETGEPLAFGVLNAAQPLVIAPELEETPGLSPLLLERLLSAGLGSAVCAPLRVRDELLGLLCLYRSASAPPFREDDLETAQILVASGAMAYDTSRSWQRLEAMNRGLESTVAERTAELQRTLAEAQGLAAELRQRNAELEAAYGELAELDRVKAELITRISHELKTPVTSLVTAARILERYKDAPAEKGERFLKILLDEAEKLSEMIHSVIQASALAGQGPVEKRPVPVQELLKKAVAALRDQAERRGVRMTLRVASGLENIPADEEALAAALSSVVKNAIEFSDAGGEVVVEVRRDPEHPGNVAIRITDQGVGIPENELPHVFDPFWQGGNVLTGKPKGLGLGLAIAKRVVEHHGGSVRINSEVGEGTEVVLSLPGA